VSRASPAPSPRSDHQPHGVVGRDLLSQVRADKTAVAKDGDAIGDLEHLGEPVRDEHDRDALLLEPAQHGEERRRFLRRECRGRLVQKQHPCAER
jgi:hypothetical protein